jgi:hypothetical protein
VGLLGIASSPWKSTSNVPRNDMRREEKNAYTTTSDLFHPIADRDELDLVVEAVFLPKFKV